MWIEEVGYGCVVGGQCYQVVGIFVVLDIGNGQVMLWVMIVYGVVLVCLWGVICYYWLCIVYLMDGDN